MPHIEVHPAQSPASLSARMQDHLATALARVRERAYSLFEERGREPGHELEDWLTAEHEMLDVPSESVKRTDGELRIEMRVEDFAPEELEVDLLPDALVIHGHTESKIQRRSAGRTYEESREKDLYRRFSLDEPLDESAVTAELEKGVLRVIARKGTHKESGKAARKASAAD